MFQKHCAASKWVNTYTGLQKFFRKSVAKVTPNHKQNIAGAMRNPRKSVPEVIHT